MVKKNIKKLIDKTIKEVWINEICKDYGNGHFLMEADIQCSLYYHLRRKLSSILEENNLYIYPEFYFKELRYYADLAICQMDMGIDTYLLSEKLTDVVAVIELKYGGGNSLSISEYIKTDIAKLKTYAHNLDYNCQYYFGVIYETECEWLHWFDKRSTNHWANGCLTELNAGYLDGEMYFEINSYNKMNIQQKRVQCDMIW